MKSVKETRVKNAKKYIDYLKVGMRLTPALLFFFVNFFIHLCRDHCPTPFSLLCLAKGVVSPVPLVRGYFVPPLSIFLAKDSVLPYTQH